MGNARKNDLIDLILSPANMSAAWEDVRAGKGAPGVDNVSVRQWERGWRDSIDILCEQVRANTYRPKRPRYVYIRKPSGGLRELSLFTISDKVLQRAVLNVIDDLFDSDFLDCSHGYRQGRSVATAVSQLVKHRDKGYEWVLNADILACFQNISHDLLMGLLAAKIQDWFVLYLTELWLKIGRKFPTQQVGIPMGCVLAPLWCNIYLHQMDLALRGRSWKLVRYADDFVVMADTPRHVEAGRDYIKATLTELKLILHPVKTIISDFEEGFRFIGVDFRGRQYEYDWMDKRVEVRGRGTKLLRSYPPAFYD